MRIRAYLCLLPIAVLFLTASLIQARFALGNREGSVIASSKTGRPSTEALFRQKCSKCHGVDGNGDTSMGRIFNAPDFTDAGWWAKHSNPGELTATITRGKKNMPAFRKKLTKAQISSLANYVRRFKQ